MDRRFKEEDTNSSRFSIITAIKKIAAYNARAPLDNEEQLMLFLQSWWSMVYNRPLKDPLLLSYTLGELLYEFFDKDEREKARKEEIQRMNDKIEEDKDKEALDWAEAMEKKELEDLRKQAQPNPAQNPENVKWMEEQIKKAKEIYGDSFGEDISENFDE